MDKKDELKNRFITIEEDGRLQILAGNSLLEQSSLVKWSSAERTFISVDRDNFECSWKKVFDPTFGRFICWILFSSGAELFAKGICLINQVEIRHTRKVRSYPSSESNIDLWISAQAKAIKSKSQAPGYKFPVANYRTLDYLIRGARSPKNKTSPDIEAPFFKLFRKMNASESEENLILSSYDLLRETIRNRDAHAYVPNVRDAHVNLVSELFTDCFNIFTKWIPGGAHALNKWRENSATY